MGGLLLHSAFRAPRSALPSLSFELDDLQLLPGEAISGTVRDAGGPRAGVRVQVVEELPASELASLPFPGGPPLAEYGLDHALTTSDGGFQLTDLPAGELRLRLLGADGAELKELTVETGKDPLEIVLD